MKLDIEQLEQIQRVIIAPITRISILDKLVSAHVEDLNQLKAKAERFSRITSLARTISHAAMFVIGCTITSAIEWFFNRHSKG